MKINVYDFDNTIYDGDSTVDFWKYCVRKYPVVLLPFPLACAAGFCCLLGLCSKTRFKEIFYRFFRYVPNINGEVARFWDNNFKKIRPWYLAQNKMDDLIISASPEFLLSFPCERMGVRLIASRVDSRTGKALGGNCKGMEKVRRFRAEYPEATIEEFYSDSLSDSPLSELAERAYLIKSGIIKKWSI